MGTGGYGVLRRGRLCQLLGIAPQQFYAKEKKGSHGWPLTAMVVQRPDGAHRLAEIPEHPIATEIGWIQAYVRDCRGWRNPQAALPDLLMKNGVK